MIYERRHTHPVRSDDGAKEGDLLYRCSSMNPSQPSARIGWDAKTNNASDSQEGTSRMLKRPSWRYLRRNFGKQAFEVPGLARSQHPLRLSVLAGQFKSIPLMDRQTDRQASKQAVRSPTRLLFLVSSLRTRLFQPKEKKCLEKADPSSGSNFSNS